MSKPYKILMVCLGNICRSPLAEGLLREKANKYKLDVEIDSAGTASYHIGRNPDERMIQTAIKNGFSISNLQARQIAPKDLNDFDIIYAMDTNNYQNILRLSDDQSKLEKVHLILNELYPNENRSVPDPYYDGQEGFDLVYQLLNEATEKIAKKLRKNQ